MDSYIDKCSKTKNRKTSNYLKVTKNALKSSEVMDIHTPCSELHSSHYGQNQLEGPAADQVSLHFEDEGKNLKKDKWTIMN